MKASDGGKIPIVCDTSPCLSTLKGALQTPDLKCAPLLHLPACKQRAASSAAVVAMPETQGQCRICALVCASICLQ